MAGGRGERLWPLSDETHPKPFLKLFKGQSLLECTLQRIAPLTDPDRIFIITAATFQESVHELLPDFPQRQLLLEPQPRNTAAAVALACGTVLQRDPKAITIVLPADHVIHDAEAFRMALQHACEEATLHPQLVTLGITPTHPSPEYGYIACGEICTTTNALRGIGFTEKPDIATATVYLKAGNFLWNAGIFVGTAATFATHFHTYAPAFDALIAAPEMRHTCYSTLPTIAFDRAIMEKCETFGVVRGTFDWDDVGTLEALARQFPVDNNGNVANEEALFDASSNCITLTTQPNHRILLLGLHDLLVTQTADTTLICPRNEAHALRKRFVPPSK